MANGQSIRNRKGGVVGLVMVNGKAEVGAKGLGLRVNVDELDHFRGP